MKVHTRDWDKVHFNIILPNTDLQNVILLWGLLTTFLDAYLLSLLVNKYRKILKSWTGFASDRENGWVKTLHTYTHIQTYIHTYIHDTHTHKHYLRTYTHTYIHIHTHTYKHTYIQTYLHTHTDTRAHTHTHTDTHTHTHTHTHTEQSPEHYALSVS